MVVKERSTLPKGFDVKDRKFLEMLRDDRRLSIIVDSSEIVHRCEALYEEAPEPVQNLIRGIKESTEGDFGSQSERIRNMFEKTMNIKLDADELDKLTTVATVELILLSPIPLMFLKSKGEQRGLHGNEWENVSKWMEKHMSAAARNLVLMYEYYPTDEIRDRIEELDEAVRSVGVRQRVLDVIGMNEDISRRIIKNDINRINQPGNDSKKHKLNVEYFLEVMRKSKIEVRINSDINPYGDKTKEITS
ncbi:MAG: hypothetical protein KGI06_03310 [Candidatus Micrarchaeota archaeon]|nr:hypothetical protein [Candidatus Micrarchaeota archaeon]